MHEARRKIFGHWRPEGANASPFTALKRLRNRGWIGPQVKAYFPEPHPMWKHPLYREAFNEARQAEVDAKKKIGKGPPKKGEGKRAGRKK